MIVETTKGNVHAVLRKVSWKDIGAIYPDYTLYARLLPTELELIKAQHYKESMRMFGIAKGTVTKIRHSPLDYCLEPYKENYSKQLKS